MATLLTIHQDGHVTLETGALDGPVTQRDLKRAMHVLAEQHRETMRAISAINRKLNLLLPSHNHVPVSATVHFGAPVPE
jgi:hypothetical protein